MSYVYEVLCDYRNYENEEEGLTQGQALYKSLYDDKGYLRYSWVKAYTEWLNELCDLNNLPTESVFRRCFINDAMDNSKDDLEVIKRWWTPDEEESDKEESDEDMVSVDCCSKQVKLKDVIISSDEVTKICPDCWT